MTIDISCMWKKTLQIPLNVSHFIKLIDRAVFPNLVLIRGTLATFCRYLVGSLDGQISYKDQELIVLLNIY